MWEQYKEKDNRILRPLDGSEFVVNGFYINIVDVFPKISTEDFKKRIQEELPKVDIFNITIKIMDGHFFFIKKPFEAHVQEVEWTENEEIENYLQHQGQMVIPYERQMEENNDVVVCFSFKICQLKNNKTKITFTTLHSICDGRTAFYLMELLQKVIRGEKLEKMEAPLCPFGHKEVFHDADKVLANTDLAQLYGNVDKANLLPPLSPPFNNVCVHYMYDCPPIKRFCKKNGVGIQALAMAAIARATRRFHHLPKEKPLWCIVPVDTRYSTLATTAYKNCKFFCNTGILYVKTIGQATLMEDIQHCQHQLKEHQQHHEAVAQLISCSQLIQPESLQFIPTFAIPGTHSHAVISVSNFGRVSGNQPLFYANALTHFGTYEFLHEIYYTEHTLYVSNYKPKDFDETFLKYIKEEMDHVFKL